MMQGTEVGGAVMSSKERELRPGNAVAAENGISSKVSVSKEETNSGWKRRGGMQKSGKVLFDLAKVLRTRYR